MRKGLAATVKGEAAKIRDRLPDLMGQLGPSPSHADIVDMNRSLHPLD